MMISGMPITKYGIEYRIRLIPLPTRSIPPPRFQPDLRAEPQPDHDRDRLAQADEQHGRPDGVDQDVGDGLRRGT